MTDHSNIHPTIMKKIKTILSGITVEPILFLTVMSDMIYRMVVQNLYMEKACRVSLEMPSSTCDAMSRRNQSGFTFTEEIEVQKLSSGYMAVANALHGLFPVVLALFVGSWSDRHSLRKPVILAPAIGMLVTLACLILNTIFFKELPLIFTVLSDAIFFPLMGGLPCLFLGIYSLVGATTSNENRTVRMGGIATAHSLSMVLGLGLSGFLYSFLGFINTFTLCAIFVAIGLLLGHVLLEDVPVEKSDEDSNYSIKPRKSFLCDFFDVRYFLNTLKVCFKSNENNRRNKVLALMVLGIISGGPIHGEMAVSYMYTRYRYGWNMMKFSGFSFFHLLSQSFASLISLALFSKYLKWEDPTLGIIGCISSIVGALICAFATASSIFVLGGIVDCFMIAAHIAIRSNLSKVVAPRELGQMNSIFGAFQAFSQFLFSPFYNLLYKSTILFLPGAFYIFSAVMKVIGLYLFIYLYMETKKTKKVQSDSKKDLPMDSNTECLS